jgi:hypothetical protein
MLTPFLPLLATSLTQSYHILTLLLPYSCPIHASFLPQIERSVAAEMDVAVCLTLQDQLDALRRQKDELNTAPAAAGAAGAAGAANGGRGSFPVPDVSWQPVYDPNTGAMGYYHTPSGTYQW